MIVKDHLMVQLMLFIYLFFKFSSFKLGLLEEYISHNTEAILRPTLSLFLAEKSCLSYTFSIFH